MPHRDDLVAAHARIEADAERAFYLEREIERRLAIADRPIDGEVPRRG